MELLLNPAVMIFLGLLALACFGLVWWLNNKSS